MQLHTFGVALLCLVTCATPSALAGNVDYKTNFSNPSKDANSRAPEPTVNSGDDAMAALREMGSFPTRLHNGTAVDDGWPNSSVRDYAPKPIERAFKIGACTFSIHTGDFTLRRYEQGPNARLSVSRDSIEKFSTLTPDDDQPVMVSVNADLYVSVALDAKNACKQLFGGRRVKIGTVDLSQTQLSVKSDGGNEASLATVAQPRRTDVYLVWDAVRNTLMLEDASGLAPAVESAVFSVAPQTAGDYYFAVTPQLGLSAKGGDTQR